MPPPVSSRSALRGHLAFTVLGALALLLMFSLLRVALLVYNHEQIGPAPVENFLEAFANGVRFDLRIATITCLPLLFALLANGAMAARKKMRLWLTAAASFMLFLGLVELDFYREFHQRLNSLVFQYIREDPKTVLSMLWYGFPVLRYLLAWAAGTWLLAALFRRIDRATRPSLPVSVPASRRWLALLLCVPLAALAIRGTLRHGPPLRWGDAFTTESMFANHLGLNGVLTLLTAAKEQFSDHRDNAWNSALPQDEARRITRELLLTPHDRLADAERAAVRRDYTPPAASVLPEVRNVVVILMESFAGRYVGALGNGDGITPYFDALAKEGLLFTRHFSNGTHTHQGMFATMACFPNLPAFEYLMQMPEGGHAFSGLPQLLSARGYNDLYVYNGDFTWDNQSGFFSNQGMTTFIGRGDYTNPAFSDPTWGVSDQDMFGRAAEELPRLNPDTPFYALLQTLSNHTPYALPEKLPVAPVTGHGPLDQHLTAMRYSDWALGQFFEKARKAPYFSNTLFVIVGDHGFGSTGQLTEMDLYRFNVPLLLLGPGVRERFGATRDTVGTQVDIVPTIMGRLGAPVRHQCWGRDLLALPPDDPGFGVIKPSGSDQTVALIRGDRILVQPKGLEARLYRYQTGANPQSQRIDDDPEKEALGKKLDAFLKTATQSLLENSTGAASAE